MKGKRRDPAAPPGRSCGDCRACCIVLGFEAKPDESPFAKPAGEPCRHLCASGCAIYTTRPPVCRRFHCAWLQTPTLAPALRPDRCGVMLTMNDNVLGEGFAVYAYELRPGAADRRPIARVIEAVASRATVILVRNNGRREVVTTDPAVGAALTGARAEPLKRVAAKRAR